MRDAILFLIFASVIPFILKRPVVGALAYACFSLMNPHRLTYGSAYDFPFAMILCILTVFSILISKEKKKLPLTPPVIMLFLFSAWMTLTAMFALEPEATWIEWERVMKTMLMVMLTILTVRTISDARALVLVVALSLGFWGLKSGLYTIMTGGRAGLAGPESSYISDNNTLALAMVTTVPLLVYLVSQTHAKWLKRAMLGLTFLTALAALGSYSRGALLGASAMALFLWIKSKSKVKTGVIILALAPVIYLSMPDAWIGRMNTIDNYQEDASAMGRINAWEFAVNIANHFPMGGGYRVFSPRMFLTYAPNPQAFHVAHSIYFQTLGEHGYLGLCMFLLLFFFSWRTGSRIVRHCANDPTLEWAATLARMCQVSIVGYLVAGAFLTLAYYDLIYYILAILVCTEKVLMLAPQIDNQVPMRIPFLERINRPKGSPAPIRNLPR